MSHTVAVFGGSFNPPGTHHRRIVEALSERFDEVLVVPCGPRPDKSTATSIDPVHRAAMVDTAFRGFDKVTVDLFDLEQATFTPTVELAARYRDRGELWFVVGSDLVVRGSDGRTELHRWYQGEHIWKELRFAVFTRPGYPVAAADLPPNSLRIDSNLDGESSRVRERVFRHETIAELVAPAIEAYISRYRLYRGGLHARSARVELGPLRPKVVVDRRNQRAAAMVERLRPLAGGKTDPRDPNCILVVGGDGTMLRAIHQHWRRRLPMIGLSAGHYGFLLNALDDVLVDGAGLCTEYIVQHLPLLYVERADADGETRTALAFNDAWVERATPQTAWIEVAVDGAVRLPRLVSDGVLVSTASGSTAYARAMGATPLRVDTPELLLVGNNVAAPLGWKSAHLSLESEIEFRALDPVKRPVRGFADGVALGPARRLRIRRSRIATVELAFTLERDLTAKLTDIQFPG